MNSFWWLPPRVRKNCVGTTGNRRKRLERGGKIILPYLICPNTESPYMNPLKSSAIC